MFKNRSFQKKYRQGFIFSFFQFEAVGGCRHLTKLSPPWQWERKGGLVQKLIEDTQFLSNQNLSLLKKAFKIPQGDFSKPRNLNVTSDLPKISGGTQF